MSKIIGEIQKNQTEKIKISIEEYRGSTFIDLRVYWQDADEWRPSKKGIALSGETIDEVIPLLQKASKALEG